MLSCYCIIHVLGPAHADELGYLFNSVNFKNITESTEENKMVNQITSLWTRFAAFEWVRYYYLSKILLISYY